MAWIFVQRHLIIGVVCTLITYWYFLWNKKIHNFVQRSTYTTTHQHMQYAFITYPNYGSKIVVWMFKERVVVTGAELRLKQTNKQTKRI